MKQMKLQEKDDKVRERDTIDDLCTEPGYKEFVKLINKPRKLISIFYILNFDIFEKTEEVKHIIKILIANIILEQQEGLR